MIIKLQEDAVKALFEEHQHQSDVLLALYRMVFPDWDQIEKLDGWPRVNVWTWEQISKWFMAFDRVHYPDVMNGGAWMNSGFSTLTSDNDVGALRDWQVSVDGVKVTYQETVEAQ